MAYQNPKIIGYEQAAAAAQKLRSEGRKIVFASGAYDIPHVGHAYFFRHAHTEGEALFVSVGSDENIRILKGPTRPVLPQTIRAWGVAEFEAVDFVVPENEEMTLPDKINFHKLIALVKPDIFALNNTDSAIDAKREYVERLGAELRLVDVTGGPDISTTAIIDKVKSR